MRTVVALAVLAAFLAAPVASAACVSVQGQVCADPRPEGRSTWHVDGHSEDPVTDDSDWFVHGSASSSKVAVSGDVWNRRAGMVEPDATVERDASGVKTHARLWTPRSAEARADVANGRVTGCLASDVVVLIRC